MPNIDRRALLLAGAGLLAMPGRAAAGVPQSAEGTFGDSVGVNVHLSSEPYCNDVGRLRQRLADSGIRHLRDELRPSNDIGQWRALHADLGIRFNVVVSPATNTVAEMMAYLDALGLPCVSAIEGQNEGDSDWFMSLPLAKPDWTKTVIDYQKAFHQALRARPDTQALPVLSPSVIDWKPADAVLLRPAADFCDIVALHPYVQRGQEPETNDDYASIAWYLHHMRDAFKPGAAVMATETGYCNAITTPGSGVSERAAAIYLPRMLLNNYQLGIRRSFMYEFMNGGTDPKDGEQNWGLLHSDSAPKPSYHAIRRLLAALGNARIMPGLDNGFNIMARSPRADLRQIALQDDAGRRILALWHAARSWDAPHARDIEVDAQPVEINGDGRPTAASMNIPNDDDQWRDLVPSQTGITVPVADKVVLLRLA
ncbi:MAG: hypothetical protein ABWY18_09390 [Tardiphaga sp.]